MERKTTITVIIIGIILVFITALAATFYLTPNKTTDMNSTNLQNKSDSNLKDKTPTTVVLGQDNTGTVSRMGPYGNVNSKTKIAYIVGVHPNESQSHQALVESVKTLDKSLDKCYYIYQVNVTSGADSYSTGRMNGQLLAQKFVVPDIKDEKFNLAVDVHSNVGNWAENRFIFSPVSGSSAEKIAYQIKDQLPWLAYYVPPNPTSPTYVTQPLIDAGVPAVIYETYVQDSYETMRQHASELVKVVDKLNL